MSRFTLFTLTLQVYLILAQELCVTENEAFLKCGPYCEPNCKEMNPQCPRFCIAGCFCKTIDYVRDLETKLCVRRDECSSEQFVINNIKHYKLCFILGQRGVTAVTTKSPIILPPAYILQIIKNFPITIEKRFISARM